MPGPQFAYATIAGSGATETAAASSALKSGVSGKNQVGAPNQSALKFPTIYFAANNAEVLASSNPLLRQAARLVNQLPAGTLVEMLSAEPSSMQGSNPAMLSAKGYGSSHSLASKNGTVESHSNGMMEDRRRN